MAVADASFSTSIDWISLGSMDMSGLLFGSLEFEPCSAGRPSMTYSGSLLALIEPFPRIRTRAPTPGMPELSITCTPAALPWRPLERVTVGAALVANASDSDPLERPPGQGRGCA